MGSFRGATQQGFSDRIRSHRLFLGTRTFKPIRLNFRKPGNPFELARRPRARRTDPVRYVFSPTFQLTFPFSPVSNLFFETNTESRFQWLVSEMTRLRPAGEPPAYGSPGGGSWRTLRQFRDYREVPGTIQRERALMLLREGRAAWALAAGPRGRGEASRGRGGAPRGAPAPLFFTILHTAQHWTQALDESLGRSNLGRSGAGRAQGRTPRGGRIRQTEKTLALRGREQPLGRERATRGEVGRRLRDSVALRFVFDLGGAARAVSSLHTSLTTIRALNAVALRQAFFTQLTLPASRVNFTQLKLPVSAARPAPLGEAFAGLSLTFAASRPVDAARPNQTFGPPVVLSYAKRESQQMHAVVNALRDLRPSQSETRAPAAPQLPSIEQLTSQVRRQLERELRIEKERRGL
jgi:hypothetical protein